eukprot:10101314-Alexandrium_andersonii.AAC.1
MSASLVGSEMCIRDRETPQFQNAGPGAPSEAWHPQVWAPAVGDIEHLKHCLLYTSDAADDM